MAPLYVLPLAAAVASPGDPVAYLSIRPKHGCRKDDVIAIADGPDITEFIEPPAADGARFSFVADAPADAWAARHCDVVAREAAEPFNATQGRRPPPNGYDSPEAIMQMYEDLARAHPSVARLIDLTETLGQPETHEGRHIYALKISDNVADDEDEPNVLLLPNVHARELITPQIGIDTATRLVTGYARGGAARRVVDDNQIYMVVSQNPDGWAYTWSHNNMWRKNRRSNGGSFGVDNNRNMPFGWSGYSCSGSTSGSSETYRGPSAGSEPETQTIMALMRDRNPAKAIDIHSHSRDVRINYAQAPPNGVPSLPSAFDELGRQIAVGLADKMSYIQVRSGACGTIASQASHAFGAMSFLIETGRAFQPPAAEMREEVARVWPGLEWYLQVPISIVGHVVDASSGQGVEATLEMPDMGFAYDERRQSSPRTGRFALWAPAGSHRVVASAPGYAAATVTVAVTDGATTTADIRLQPARL